MRNIYLMEALYVMTCASTLLAKNILKLSTISLLSETGILFISNSLDKDHLLLSFPIVCFNTDKHFYCRVYFLRVFFYNIKLSFYVVEKDDVET